MEASTEELAQEWLRLDQDPETRNEIEQLIARNDTAELEKRLRKRIAFGTAGLRATMNAGFSRMNSLTVIQASQGLAAYVLEQVPSSTNRGVVIGRDARYNSEKFAKLTAAVFAAKGFKVWFLDMVHTPLVPFAVSRLNAAVGVMVTASHNPAVDNGYKVYWLNGCQIIPPHDNGIARSIMENLEPITWDIADMRNDLSSETMGDLKHKYLDSLSIVAAISAPKVNLPFTYTPMHGVGLGMFERFAVANHLSSAMHVVSSQKDPDPAFPTVRFPNPEEKGAMDEAMKTADGHDDSLILANDPDADRFAAAEKVDGRWQQLTGNQIGVLLASHVLEENARTVPAIEQPTMLASTVSSRMLARMAAVDGTFRFEETLTGFKWLGNRAQDLDEGERKTLYAYEEAIGFMFPHVVYDKDGIVAAAVFLAACLKWRTAGLTPWSKLQQLYRRYGFFEEANTYLVSPSPDVTTRIFNTIRQSTPQSVGSRRILRWRDLTTGFDSGTSDHVPLLPVDKSAQMITCELEGGVAFTTRGSGTEPKIKLYIEGVGESADEAKTAAAAVLQDLLHEWFKPEQNRLSLA